MRTFATLFTVGTLFAVTIAQTVPWSLNLSCGACAIGGYRFCYQGAKGECCKAGDTECMTRNGNKCTSEDKFTAVYKDCERGNFRNKELCGNPNVRHIDNTTTVDVFNIPNMPIGESCTFKVFSKCSWPKFEVNSTEVDMWVTAFKGKPSDNNENDDSAKFSPAVKGKGKSVAEPDNSNKTTDCNSQIRMYVTVTRL